MAKIKVHVLNFHNIWSHIEILLENQSVTPHTHYLINRWGGYENEWYPDKSRLSCASSIYSFEIDEEPNEITKSWKKYYNSTKGHILGNNCAVAAQWFLTEFAGIPEPNLSNISLNHLAFGIMWPSFVPCPVTLPGRVMSNAKFYIEARNHPELAEQYTRLFLYTSMALATMAFSASIFALAVASTILTGGTAALAIAGSTATAFIGSYGFFKAYHTLSAKNIIDNVENIDMQVLLPDTQ